MIAPKHQNLPDLRRRNLFKHPGGVGPGVWHPGTFQRESYRDMHGVGKDDIRILVVLLRDVSGYRPGFPVLEKALVPTL